MKKLIIGMLAIVTCFGLSGCGIKDGDGHIARDNMLELIDLI